MSSNTAKVIQRLHLSRSDFSTCASATVLREPHAEPFSGISAVCSVVESLSHIWLCCSMDCSLPGSSICGISQARILEWFAISFSRGIFQTQGLNLHLLHCRWILYLWATRKALSAVYIKPFWFFPWHSVSFPDLVMLTARDAHSPCRSH